MQTKIEWTARVNASEPVGALDEFASETKRGLIDSEMIPEDAWVESTSFDWNRNAQVVLRWDTINEMELTEKYVPPSSDRTPAAKK